LRLTYSQLHIITSIDIFINVVVFNKSIETVARPEETWSAMEKSELGECSGPDDIELNASAVNDVSPQPASDYQHDDLTIDDQVCDTSW